MCAKCVFVAGAFVLSGFADITAHAADDEAVRTSYAMRVAWVGSAHGVRPCEGDPAIPKELWITKADAEAYNNRLFALLKAVGYEEKSILGPGHCFWRWPERFWYNHRDYFGMLPNGQRGADIPGFPSWIRTGSKMCLSNEAVIDRLIADWIRKGKPRELQCGENDTNFGYCRCAGCRALDADLPGEPFLATKTDRYVNYWNRVSARARQVRPDVKVLVHLYGRYYDPPRRERIYYPDNMEFSFVAKYEDRDPVGTIRAWQKVGLKHFYFRPNYLCNRSAFPMGREKFIWRQHRDLLAIGSMGDTFDATSGVPATFFDHYTAFRVCADPNVSFAEIERDWCGRYGAASETVKAYHRRIRERCDCGFEKLLDRFRRENIQTLDDSHFSRYYHTFHDKADLEGDLALLERFDDSVLAGEPKRLFADLKANARHYILTRQALATESESDKKALLDYRIARRSSLGAPWSAYWHKGEFWLWKQRDPAKKIYEDSGIVRVADEIERTRLLPYVPEINVVLGDKPGDGCRSRDVPKELHVTAEQERKWFDLQRQEWKNRDYNPSMPYHCDHSFRKWTETLWDSHRDYFGMLPNGQRGVSYPNLPSWMKGLSKVCVSNERVIDERIAEWERAGCPRLLIAGENDGLMGFCRCEKCRALDADADGEPFCRNKADRYVDFWNRLAAKARAKRPDVWVTAYVYGPTRRPPRRTRVAYPDNMIFSYVPTLHDEDPAADIVGWKAMGAKLFYNRPNYLCMRTALPTGLEKLLFDMSAATRKEGSLGNCFDRSPGLPAQGFAEYTAMMLCIYPTMSFENIEQRWCERFGKGAETAKAYYRHVRARCERGWPRVRKYLKDNDIEFLDDSHFSRVAHHLHTVAELEEDLAILRKFDYTCMRYAPRGNYMQLLHNAEHAILVQKMMADNTPANLAAVLAYRIKHKDDLGWRWDRIYTKGEFWIWDEKPEKVFYENSAIMRYAERLEAALATESGALRPEDPESRRLNEILKAANRPH